MRLSYGYTSFDKQKTDKSYAQKKYLKNHLVRSVLGEQTMFMHKEVSCVINSVVKLVT